MATFLIISPEAWADNAVSKHHYALTLAARGHDILFLNPPTEGSELTLSRSGQSPGVQVVDGPPVARGLRYLPASVRRFLEARWLEQLETRAGKRVDAVWLFENSRFYDMCFAGPRLKVYHQVDLNQSFHPHAAARSADVCFCTTEFIRMELLKVAQHVYKVHHGTPVVPKPLQLTPEQRQSFEGAGVNAAYIGSLAMEYIDVELMIGAVEACPQVRFHLVGSYTEHCALRMRSQGLPNVVWWGKLPSALIPALLAQVDVVMCTYQASRYGEQLASPHKFMEYLGSGKVLVTTYTDEYKDKRELVCMVDAREDYISAFRLVVANLGSYNSVARQQERKAFAAAHSYDAQLDKIIHLVTHGTPAHARLFRAAHVVAMTEPID